MKIRSRLALYGAGLAALGMFLFVMLLTGLVGASGEENQKAALADIAEAAAAALVTIPTEPPVMLVDPATTSEIFVVIVDHQGSVYSEAIGETPELSEGLIDWSGRQFRASGSPIPGGVVYALQGTDFVDQQADGFQAVVWIATVVTVIAAMIVSWFVSGRALRPLRQLADTADAIDSGDDLGTRLPVGTANDEVQRLSVSFNSMLDRLQSALQSADSNLERQRRFVADASHDLRTPLTTIRANAGFLLDRPDATVDDRSEAMSDVAAEADRMAAMLDDLSLLASADSDRPLQYESIDMAALAGNAAARASRVGDRDVTVHGVAPLVIQADRASLERVLWILIENALVHGEGPVQVGLAGTPEGVRISVRDQGRGIEDSNRERVFDRFYREETSRTSEGSGLGLSIVRAIIEQHGGSVTARNMEPGFEVALQLPVSSASHF